MLHVRDCIHHGANELDCLWQNDSVAEPSQPFGASSSHSFGKPINQRLCAGLSWPEAPVLVPRRGPAVDPLDVSGPVASDGASPGWIVESDAIARTEGICGEGVDGTDVSCAWSDRLVSEIPRLDPFSLASSFRSRKRSGVPPASREAGVAQLDGVDVITEAVAAASDGNPPVPRFTVAGRSPFTSLFTGVDHGVGSMSLTVSIRFDRFPSMCAIEPPRVAHDAFGVGYGAGLIWSTTSFKFEIPGGPPSDRIGARALIASICSGVFATLQSCACGVGYEAGIWDVSLAASSKVVPGLPAIM